MNDSCPPKAEAADSNSAGCTTFSAVCGARRPRQPRRTLHENARTDQERAFKTRTAIRPDNSPRIIHAYLNKDPAIIARFWEKVDRRGPDDCWPWTASNDGRGYGHMKVASHETRGAHRIAWTIHNNREPAPFLVRHSCDNPACCNPAHLLLGTHQDNMDDKSARGRHRSGRQDGEHNGNAVLTTEQVGQIVQCFRDGLNNQQISRRFPVGDALISRIRVGRSWQKEAASFGWQPRPLIRHPFCRLNKEQAA